MRTTKFFKFSLVAFVLFTIVATIAIFKDMEVKTEASELDNLISNKIETIDVVDFNTHPTETQTVAVETSVPETHIYAWEDVSVLAKTAYGECRGMWSKTEISCVMWTILNRLDHGGYGWTVLQVATAPNQFYYKYHFPTVNDYGIDLVWLADNVLRRWENEKLNGVQDPGRTLPKDYLWYASHGDGHNYFRNKYRTGNYYTYWLGTPYDS